MNIIIERKCEQCGGEMEIQETATLLECPWCGVRHFLEAGHARYILPHKDIEGELIHVPYLRIKGSLFTCSHTGVHHRVVDTTVSATGINILPPTLGVRPQAMKLQFASDAIQTTYLKHSMKWHEAVDHAAPIQNQKIKAILHQEWIGETLATIYQPLIIQDGVIRDGVTGDRLAKLPREDDLFAPIRMKTLGWHTTLHPTLCPNCGWDMESDHASVIHLCQNCDTAWRHQSGQFKQVPFATIMSSQPDTTYLPFWRMHVDFEGIELSNLADFIRKTNIPRAIKPEWENEPLAFFCPAFKIRPKIFLRVASQLTAAQQPIHEENVLPGQTTAVSLAAAEAEDAIKLILANSAVAKRTIMPILSAISLANIKTTLVFLPFFDNGYEFCQEEL
ncbi:MAG: hypothetical protein PF495_16975, partial [Spirochaetales bacterium]|nr:hypothetical protein [Spirochaetales bacterium]